MKVAALVVASCLAANCMAQMSFESRESVLDLQTSGGGGGFDRYTGFGFYDNSISTSSNPGASASQTSSLTSGSISYSGSGSAGGSGGPGQPRGSGESSINVFFTVSSSVSWSFAGSLNIIAGNAAFSLRNVATNRTVFNYGLGSPNSEQRMYDGSGTLAAGRYEFVAYTGGYDGGRAQSQGVFTVVPAPASLALAATGIVALGRRRR